MRRQELHGDEDSRIRRETEGCEIFAEMESDGFPEVLRYLIQGLPLGDDRDLEAFGHVPRLLARRITALIVCWSINAVLVGL